MKETNELFAELSEIILADKNINAEKFIPILEKLKESLVIAAEADRSIYSYYINHSEITKELCLAIQDTPGLISAEQGGVGNLLIIAKYTNTWRTYEHRETIIGVLIKLST